MSKQIHLVLTDAQRQELTDVRDHHARAYLRERAAALLKIAGGASARQVAGAGLLRPRKPDTVYAWVQRYRAAGLAGLRIKPGRGRKPAFSPSAAERRTGQADPAAYGAAQPGAVRPPAQPLDAGQSPGQL